MSFLKLQRSSFLFLLLAALCVFILQLPCGSQPAHAVGVGGYYTSSSGTFNLNWDDEGNIWNDAGDGKNWEETIGGSVDFKDTQGAGIFLDTAVAKNSIFNYRFSLAFEKLQYGVTNLEYKQCHIFGGARKAGRSTGNIQKD